MLKILKNIDDFFYKKKSGKIFFQNSPIFAKRKKA